MQTKFPVFDKCTIQGSGQENLLAMDLSEYMHKYADMVFPHRHNFYHLVVFTSGKGSFTIDFTNFTIEPYTAYFMVPGQVHTWDFEGVPQGYIVNFSADFYHSFLLDPDYIQRFSFLSGHAPDQVLCIPERWREQTDRLMGELINTYPAAEDSTGGDISRIALLHFFTLMEQGTGHQASSGTPETRQALLRQFRSLVETHFREEKFPRFYAGQLHVSPNHLNNVCKTYLGKQAGEYIRERIILEAKRLLVNPATTISSLAYELNFNDNSYFTKFFKKSENITPEEFRRKYGALPHTAIHIKI